jgi:hypothetical protein
VDDLTNMTQHIFQLFQQFVAGARSVIAEEGLYSPAAAEKILEDQQRLVQETDEVMKTFRMKVAAKERELRQIVNSRPEDLTDQTRAAIRKLYQLIDYLSLKDQLIRRWKEQDASAIVADYQEALSVGDLTMAEIFEAEAEWYLTQKGDPNATSKFLSLCAEFGDARLTPAQKKAKADLNELERIKREATVAMSFLASAARVFGHPGPFSDQWRKEERHQLDTVDLLGVSLAIHAEESNPVHVAMIDVSMTGLRVRAPRQFSPGTTVTLSIQYPGVTEGPIYFAAEVRWSEEDPGEPGWYTLGLQVVEGANSPWLDVFPKIVEQTGEFRALFSSPFNSIAGAPPPHPGSRNIES